MIGALIPMTGVVEGRGEERPRPPDGWGDRLRSARRVLFAQAKLSFRRTRQFFRLPACYRRIRESGECPRRGLGLVGDLLELFYSYKTYPDHYGPCHLWDKGRSEWKYYYGSIYHPHQSARLSRAVQPLEYRILFNDKSLTVLFCRALGIRVPLTHGVIDPSGDYRAKLEAWLGISAAPSLFIKPLCGRAGLGIALARKSRDGVIIHTAGEGQALRDYVLPGKAIVQDALRQHPRMALLSPSSVNTIRIVTMLTREGRVLITNANMRCGVGGAFVDNFSAGGISAGIELETGRLFKWAYDNAWRTHLVHPSTGVVFERFEIPEWAHICEFAVTVQANVPFYRLLGLDIALDERGDPVLIEINGAPDLLGLEQKAGPLLRRESVLRAFGEYDLLVNAHQRRLYRDLIRNSAQRNPLL